MSTATDQQMTALAKANDVRMAAARTKRAIGSHHDQATSWGAAADVLSEHPGHLKSVKVRALLMACNRLGEARINVMFRTCGIGETFTVGSLTNRQRAALVAMLRRGSMRRVRVRESEFAHPDDVVRRGVAW